MCISTVIFRKTGGGEEEEEEASSWRKQSPNNTIMIRGLPAGATEEEVNTSSGSSEDYNYSIRNLESFEISCYS